MADQCDRCGKRRELYHNETTGLSFCESCDAEQDAIDAAGQVTERRETLGELLTRADRAAEWLRNRAAQHRKDSREYTDAGFTKAGTSEFWQGQAREDSAAIVQSIADSLRANIAG